MSKKNLGASGVVFPGAVLIIGTYDENGVPDAMNAAWGGQCGPKHIAMNLGKHKTTDNLEKTKAFTIAFGDAQHIVESDYVGIVSGDKVPDKISRAGLTAVKSEFVDAPIFSEFPVTLECKLLSFGTDEATGELRAVGEIVNVTADESVLTDGKIDWSKVRPIVFDGVSAGYWVVGERVGNAFSDGKKLI